MKKTLRLQFLKVFVLLILGLFFNKLSAQGIENFSNIPASNASYANRSWTGTDNVTWTATLARTDQTLNGKAICTNGAGKITSPTYSGGIGTLQFNYVRGFTGTNARSIEVYVNNVKIGSTITVNPNSSTIASYSSIINVSGDVVLELRMAGTQIIIDDISWTAYSNTSPIISSSLSSLADFGSVNVNSVSPNSSFTVSGSNLTENINVTVPSSNFQVSLDGTTGWGASVLIPFGSGTITNIPLYVRFSPQSSGLKSGDVLLTSNGATQKTVSVSGTGVAILPEPTNHVTNFTAMANNHSQISLSWNDAVGTDLPTGYVIMANQTGSFSLPVDGSDPVQDSDLSDGSAIIKVLQGTQTAIFLGLASETNYQFVIYSYSNAGANINFKTTPAGPISNATTAVTPTYCGSEDFTNSSLTASYADGSFVGNNGITWTYIASRDENADDNNSGIQGKAIMLRRLSDNSKITSSSVPNGIGSFSVKLYKGFTSVANRQVELFVNGVSKGTSIPFQDTAEHIFTVEGINISGSVVIEIRNITVNQVILDDITWTCYESTSTTWENGAWSNGAPTASLDAIVAQNYSTGAASPQGPFTAKSLTVNSGTFTVAPGTSVTIENAIVNNAGSNNFIVENNANLIQTNAVANTGAIKVRRNSNPLYRYDYTLWSSPVIGQNLKAFSSGTLSNRFYLYNTATNTNGEYETVFPAQDEATYNFAAGSGYLIRTSDSYPIYVEGNPGTVINSEFTGVPYNQALNVNLSSANNGFNLVGNPYTSAISISQLFSQNSDAIDGTIWFWRKRNGATGSGYATSTGLGVTSLHPEATAINTNGVIGTGQGFFVKVKAGATQNTLNFSNTLRSANTGGSFFRNAEVVANSQDVERHRIWLNLSNATEVVGQTLLGYMTGATSGVDYGIEGKYFNDSPVAFTSYLENQEFAIQGRSLPFVASDIVPMAFKTDVAGSYSIAIDHVDGLFAEDQNIYLKDNFTGQLHDIKSSSYSFASESGIFNNRFEVVYQSQLSVEVPQISENSIIVYKQNGNLVVNAGNYLMSKIELYDVSGRLVYTKNNIDASATVIGNLSIANQVLVVKITTAENGTANKKIVY